MLSDILKKNVRFVYCFIFADFSLSVRSHLAFIFLVYCYYHLYICIYIYLFRCLYFHIRTYIFVMQK